MPVLKIKENGEWKKVSKVNMLSVGQSGSSDLPDAEGVGFGMVYNAVDRLSGRCKYNNVLVTKIPEDVISNFPYCWMNDLQNGTYSLIVAAQPWYYVSGKMNLPTSCKNRKYTLGSAYDEWVLSNTYNDTGNYSVTDSYVLWVSHDIPNGSTSSTDIYFYSSEPEDEIITVIEPTTLVEREPEYKLTDDRLNAISVQVQRLGNITELVTPENIEESLKKVITFSYKSNASGASPEYEHGIVENILDMSILNFESSAIGELTE